MLMRNFDKKRQQDERKFERWESLPSGGRQYWFEVERKGWKATYTKDVDAKEKTVHFGQYVTVCDKRGKAKEFHGRCAFQEEDIKALEKVGSVRVTREVLAQKLSACLNQQTLLSELVRWALSVMMAGDFEESDYETLREVVAWTGMLDIVASRMGWDECKRWLEGLKGRLEAR